jgi:hypothetical protein
MKINRQRFESLMHELIDENPLACQGILSILRIEYTDQVPSLAVSLEEPPRLLINLDFLIEHTTQEIHVKSVLLHEFLHVLLNHTEQFKQMDRATNIALDAIINHIIHRSQGEDYSEFFRIYYQGQKGYASLLRPDPHGTTTDDRTLERLHLDLLSGSVVVDDLLDLVREIRKEEPAPLQLAPGLPGDQVFIGNHTGNRPSDSISGKAREILHDTLKSFNGHGIYRSPQSRGFGANPYLETFAAKDENLIRWEINTWKILTKLCTPDPRTNLTETEEQSVLLPVLNERDRRAFLKSTWSPLIPDVSWPVTQEKPQGTTMLYFDVSGSMYAEMQALVHLLHRLMRYIRKPFWAFSDKVAPAVIRNGVLKTSTSGGTSINSVLAHFAESHIDQAVIITDGYIESCDAELLRCLGGKTLHAIVSRDGSTRELNRAGIPAYQLEQYPAGTPA